MLKNKAEMEFFSRLEMRGEYPEQTTKEVDMFQHIDIISNKVGYDVKDVKRRIRSEEPDPNIIWLEMRNVRGSKGWLCGDADKIAFFDGEKFDIVDRQKLLNFTREFVGEMDTLPPIVKEPEYKKLYRRSSRPWELSAYIYRTDIEHLIEERI